MRLCLFACLVFWVSVAAWCRGASVKLAWNPNPPEDKVISYEAQAAEVWGFSVIKVLTSTTQATITGLEPGVEYFFSVRAFNAVAASEFSEFLYYQVPIMLRLTIQRSPDLATWTDAGEPLRIEKQATEFFRVKMEVEP